MNYLLDTHTLLWFLFDDSRLSSIARNIVVSNQGSIFVSIASLWEIAIKISINKMALKYNPNDLLALCRKEAIQVLNITPRHISETLNLPLIHRDPFDRMLIAQAEVEDIAVDVKRQLLQNICAEAGMYDDIGHSDPSVMLSCASSD